MRSLAPVTDEETGFAHASSRRLPGKKIPLAKRLLDLGLSGFGLVLSAPVWAGLAAIIKVEDGGPVFYAQDRVGEGGRIFRVFKFRSMVPDAEAAVGAVQATENDPRVTRVGRLMRMTAMDELPQLWNIFRGDMSFVGPRALRPGEIETTADGRHVDLADIPGYAERHRIRPGLTGIAQNLRAPRHPSPLQVQVRPDLRRPPEPRPGRPPHPAVVLDYVPREVGGSRGQATPRAPGRETAPTTRTRCQRPTSRTLRVGRDA